jgi:hypothetical protein
VQAVERAVDRPEIALHHLLALFGIGLADRILDANDRLVPRQHAGDGKEAGLQNGVDAAPEPHLLRCLRSVDDEEAKPPLDDLLLHRAR